MNLDRQEMVPALVERPQVTGERFFLVRLESLRGVACLMVAAGHSLMALRCQGWQDRITDFLLLLFNGPAAVVLFFVLSGFVLGLALDRGEGGRWAAYGQFAVRRLGRIYPAFLVSTSAIAMYLLLCPPSPLYSHGTDWLNAFYLEPLSGASILQNLLFLKSDINNVTWTLQVEMIGSLLLPVLHWGGKTLSPISKSLVLFGLIVLSYLEWVPTSLRYVYLFYLGALLAQAGPAFFRLLNRSSWVKFLLLFIALVLLLGAERLDGSDWSSVILHRSLAAAFLICAVLFSGDEALWQLLEKRVIRFYGRISYSFYLLHFIVLYSATRLLFGLVPGASLEAMPLGWGFVLLAVSVAVTTPLAFLSFYFVERPCISFSKQVCKRFVISQSRVGVKLGASLNGP